MSRFFLALILLASLASCSDNQNSNIDTDGDGVIDTLDTHPHNPLESSDRDKDGVGDNADMFPDNALESHDTDNDGLGDNSDPDIDNDGLSNAQDKLPYTPIGTPNNTDKTSEANADSNYIYNGQLCTVDFGDGQTTECKDRVPLAKAIEASGDINFQQCLSDSLTSIDYADEVTHIYCPEMDISTISGLQAFARLQSLHIGNNNLSEIDVSTNPLLAELYLAVNHLSSIDISHNSRLTTLNLNHNQLQVIDTSSNKQLQILHLNNNQLQTLEVKNNTLLQQLSLRSNQLQAVNIEYNTALTRLTIADNLLTAMDLTANLSLTHLSLSSNTLRELDISNNPALLYVNLNNNNIRTIDVSKANKLLNLSLANNALKSAVLDDNQQLSFLNLNNNLLTEIDISQSTNLQTLYLRDNRLNFNSIATDITSLNHKDARIDLSGNLFNTTVLNKLNSLAGLPKPYTGVSHYPQQDEALDLPLLVTENIYGTKFTPVTDGVELSALSPTQEHLVYVAATEEDSFSFTDLEQAVYFKIDGLKTGEESAFYVLFTDGDLFDTGKYGIGLYIGYDIDSGSYSLGMGSMSVSDSMSIYPDIDLFNKPLALSVRKTEANIIELKLYDSDDPAAEPVYTGTADASNPDVGEETINRLVIYSNENSGLGENTSKVTQYIQPPFQNIHIPTIAMQKLRAVAGADQSVAFGDVVTLDASASSSVNDDIVSYAWSEDGAVLSHEKIFNSSTFTTGIHTVTLTVSNSEANSASNQLKLTVIPPNVVPKAIAGDDQSIREDATVILDGSASTDPDGSISSYRWTEESVVLSSSDRFSKADFSVGVHTLTLTVTDNDGTTDSSDVVITVIATSYGNELLENASGDISPLTQNGWVNARGNWYVGSAELAPIHGTGFFHPGAVLNSGAGSDLYQEVDVTAYAAAINRGEQAFKFSGYLASYSSDDTASITVEYRSDTAVLTTYSTGTVKSTRVWHFRSNTKVAPEGTTRIRVFLHSVRWKGNDNDGYYDHLSLKAVNP
ncbi:MAG: thrombospondin type 3 repeat-containing protein [Pseudomonadales bacterium]|nr:thrombospondin type 3 repeat-containing protein [Pseudomonadales bacterium]